MSLCYVQKVPNSVVRVPPHFASAGVFAEYSILTGYDPVSLNN